MDSEVIEETEQVKRRYNRIAWIYDVLESGMECMINRFRGRLWGRVQKGEILEVGVGTGKNIDFYQKFHKVTAIDISEKMLAKARKRASKYGKQVVFEYGDVQSLKYPDGSFDTVVTTCVFCSVPDPVQGLKEIKRVLRPNGKLYMLEHVLSQKWWLRGLMNFFDFLPYWTWGAHINRDTVSNLELAGFSNISTEYLVGDVLEIIEVEA